MLSIDTLNQFYGESHTLWDLDLEVPAGQCTCVMGRNGVGKTTLMKAVMGEVATASGSIRYADDVELTCKRVEERSRLGIGYVPRADRYFRCSRSRKICVPAWPRVATVASRFPSAFMSFSRCWPKCVIAAVAISPAASSSNWPSGAPGAGAASVDPRRAGRGHPAQYRHPDRRGDPPADRRGRPDRAAGGAETAFCAPVRRSFCHPGPRSVGGRRRHRRALRCADQGAFDCLGSGATSARHGVDRSGRFALCRCNWGYCALGWCAKRAVHRLLWCMPVAGYLSVYKVTQ